MKPLLFWLLALSGLVSCTITADEMEPELPKAQVYNTNTVAYRLNGLPVVAHNYGTLISAIFGGGRSKPVEGFLWPDSTLGLSSVDAQNYAGPGAVRHNLQWQLPRFQGVGRYGPEAAGTSFQLETYDPATKQWVAGPPQPLAAQPPAEVMVTAWDPATRRISGTFALRFDPAGKAPAADMQDGRFELTLEY